VKILKSITLGVFLFFGVYIFCFSQSNNSIIGTWINISESENSDFKMIGTAHIVFGSDMTFSSYIHSIIIGGEMDGTEGTQELVLGRYSLTGNRLTLYINAPISGQITDTCSISINNNILELTGFTHINNQFWFGSEYGLKWNRKI